MILNRFTPAHSEVIAHHITHQFPAKEAPPEVVEAHLVGYAQNRLVDAFLVALTFTDGSQTVSRPDGEFYHLTLSVNREAGGRPRDSKALLKEVTPTTYSEWLPIRVEPQLLRN